MKTIKISKSFLEAIEDLLAYKPVAASRLNVAFCNELVNDGYVLIKTHGSRRSIVAHDSIELYNHLTSILPELSDIPALKEIICSKEDRAFQASIAGNSKIRKKGTFNGFAVYTIHPVECLFNQEDIIVYPMPGTFLFIEDWKNFIPSQDTIIIGIENMENFSKVRLYSDFFRHYLEMKFPAENKKILFVSRLLSSKDLIRWLSIIPNQYIHFGDFDLAGINIFLSEYYPQLGNKAIFLIPQDIELRLKNGNIQRYTHQFPHFKNISSDIPEIGNLINLIHKYGRCYDQEGYITKPIK